MGSRGPVRKRDAERRRRNKDGVDTLVVDLSETLAAEVEIPAPPMIHEVVDEDTGEVEELDEPVHAWHPTAVAWYLSLTRSGQAIFYEPSDWALAFLTAEQISLALESRPVQTGVDEDGKPCYTYMQMPMNGAQLAAILKSASALMSTEGDRRRLSIELDRQKQRDAIANDDNVVSIVKTREELFDRKARG